MARSYPAQTMGSVAVRFTVVKPLGGKSTGTVTTHYNMTPEQAMRDGILVLNNDGKITKLLRDGVDFDLPKHLQPEDVFAFPAAPRPEAAKRVGHELQG